MVHVASGRPDGAVVGRWWGVGVALCARARTPDAGLCAGEKRYIIRYIVSFLRAACCVVDSAVRCVVPCVVHCRRRVVCQRVVCVVPRVVRCAVGRAVSCVVPVCGKLLACSGRRACCVAHQDGCDDGGCREPCPWRVWCPWGWPRAQLLAVAGG